MLDLVTPPGMTHLVAVTLLAASFAGSFITVAFGIGGGAALLAVMATLVPPVALIPVHGAVQVGSNLGRVLATFGHVFWPAVPAFLAGTLIGAAAGGVVAVNLPPAVVQIGVGLFIAWSVLATAPRAIRDWPMAIGMVSSFLTMFFGATGVMVAAFTKSLALGRHAHVATHAVLMTAQHGVKTVTFGLLGFAFGPWIGLTAAMIATGFLGTLTGRLVLNRMADLHFRRALDAVLLILAARLVYGGIMDLRGG